MGLETLEHRVEDDTAARAAPRPVLHARRPPARRCDRRVAVAQRTAGLVIGMGDVLSSAATNMNLATAITVSGPPEAVFDALVDARRAADAVPGARLTPATPEPLADLGDQPGVGAELKLQAGGSQITYRGWVVPRSADRAAGTLACSIDAREARGAGVLRGRLDLRLDPAAEGTLLHVDAEIEVTGRAERLGEDRLREAAMRLLRRVASRLGETSAEPEPETEAAEPATLPVVTLGAIQSEPDPEPRVPGTVRLVTARPLPLSTLPVSAGGLDDLLAALRRRPWAVPLALAALVVAVLLLTRRLLRSRD
jgi:carbon monoxide dehydrogenase subunit G